MPFRSILIIYVLLAFRGLAFPAQVIATYSGDSVTVEYEGKKKMRIHLAGIDAPEMPKGILSGQPYGLKARSELHKISYGTQVNVYIERPHEYDGYYAVLVAADTGVCLNTYMVESGLAILTTIGDNYYKARLEYSYSLAFRNHWGIWSMPKLEIPFEYRQRTKKKHLD